MDEARPIRVPLSSGLQASARTIARWMLIVGYIQAGVGGLAAIFGFIALLSVMSRPELGLAHVAATAKVAGWVIFFLQGLLIQAGAEHFKAAADEDPDEAQERLVLGFQRLTRVFFYDCIAAGLVLVPVVMEWMG